MRKMLTISRFTANGHEAFEEWLVEFKANGASVWSSDQEDATDFDADGESGDVAAIVEALEQITPAGIDINVNVFFRMETRFY